MMGVWSRAPDGWMEQAPLCTNPVKPPKTTGGAPKEVKRREEKKGNIKGAAGPGFSFEANWEITTPPPPGEPFPLGPNPQPIPEVSLESMPQSGGVLGPTGSCNDQEVPRPE